MTNFHAAAVNVLIDLLGEIYNMCSEDDAARVASIIDKLHAVAEKGETSLATIIDETTNIEVDASDGDERFISDLGIELARVLHVSTAVDVHSSLTFLVPGVHTGTHRLTVGESKLRVELHAHVDICVHEDSKVHIVAEDKSSHIGTCEQLDQILPRGCALQCEHILDRDDKPRCKKLSRYVEGGRILCYHHRSKSSPRKSTSQ
jgi:hypothetical protein